MPYPTYPYGMQSSENLWTQSDGQSLNDYGYGQSRRMSDPFYNCQYQIPPSIPPDPYGWHVSQYMQNYKGEVSFNDYSSQYTQNSIQRDR